FVAFAIILEDNGSVLYTAERIGKNGKHIYLIKFRSMSESQEETITYVGRFLRATRIDELPQLWAVLRGDLSLIGPRPEIPCLVELYEQNIPYYNVRHLIKPGLSGWAQIHQGNPPKFGVQYDETELKLSYDFYYIKNRSLLVDLKIALLTVKTLLSRSGL
ncbi:MAG: sugar transferase, partial [Planctomycetes bacterium]|nr:sugar transferase [Planctomycetota bacterium]